jgi:catechol 2,3-dioxygenase-like lactoylglutathione lyase family enzyme
MEVTGAAAVLHVRNLDQSIRYYVDVLAFSEEFRFGDYAGLKMGAVECATQFPPS